MRRLGIEPRRMPVMRGVLHQGYPIGTPAWRVLSCHVIQAVDQGLDVVDRVDGLDVDSATDL